MVNTSEVGTFKAYKLIVQHSPCYLLSSVATIHQCPGDPRGFVPEHFIHCAHLQQQETFHFFLFTAHLSVHQPVL